MPHRRVIFSCQYCCHEVYSGEDETVALKEITDHETECEANPKRRNCNTCWFRGYDDPTTCPVYFKQHKLYKEVIEGCEYYKANHGQED